MPRVLLAVGGWLLAAAAATAVGLLAVSLLGTGITAQQTEPLSQQQAAAALARADTSGRAGPEPSPTPAPPPGRTVTRALSSPGGNVIARCTGSTVYLVSWTTRQGFETDDHVQGPGRSAYLKLDSDDLDVHMTVTCRQGTPVATTATQQDD